MNTAVAAPEAYPLSEGGAKFDSTNKKQLTNHAAGAIVDQITVALCSLVIVVLVRHQLGAAALGVYAILNTALALMTALETAWVGDSLTVFDRFNPRLRRALVASLMAWGAAAIIIGGFLAIGVSTPGGALIFGVMVCLWVWEETGRRIFMARFEFWQLTLNDVIDAAGTFIGLVFLREVFGYYSVTIVIAAMGIGAGLSILCAFLQLPHYELTTSKPDVKEMGTLGKRFAAWRSAQMGIRPASLYIVRIIILILTTKVVVGNLEGTRLFSVPAMTYVSGVASLLLPMYTEEEKRKTRAVPLPVMTVLLVVPVVGYAFVVLHWKHLIAMKLLGGKHPYVSTTAIIGWMMVAIMFAAGQPVANLLVARSKARSVFWIRLADAVFGLTLAAVLANRDPNLAPWALSLGMVFGTIGLGLVALHTNPPKDSGPPGGPPSDSPVPSDPELALAMAEGLSRS